MYNFQMVEKEHSAVFFNTSLDEGTISKKLLGPISLKHPVTVFFFLLHFSGEDECNRSYPILTFFFPWLHSPA
jgi:hypothetical protein